MDVDNYNQLPTERLMEMEMGTVLQEGAEEKWEAISDLDAFFSGPAGEHWCYGCSRVCQTCGVGVLDGEGWFGTTGTYHCYGCAETTVQPESSGAVPASMRGSSS